MLEYDRLLPTERAHAAESILTNPVFMYVIEDEINNCTYIAINSNVPEERERHRISVIWAENLKRRFEQIAVTGK